MKRMFSKEEMKLPTKLSFTPGEAAQVLAVMNFAIQENFYGDEEMDLFNADDKNNFLTAYDKVKACFEKTGVSLS